MKRLYYIIFLVGICQYPMKSFSQTDSVSMAINFNGKIGPMNPNYTNMKDGKKLLSEIAALSLVPFYIHAHSLLVTREGTHALKWGSTNAYTEDEKGNPFMIGRVIRKNI